MALVSLISESLILYDVLRMLNKFCKYIGESPLIVLNIKLTSPSTSIGAWRDCPSGASLEGNWYLLFVTGSANDPSSPILEFLEFITHGNV